MRAITRRVFSSLLVGTLSVHLGLRGQVWLSTVLMELVASERQDVPQDQPSELQSVYGGDCKWFPSALCCISGACLRSCVGSESAREMRSSQAQAKKNDGEMASMDNLQLKGAELLLLGCRWLVRGMMWHVRGPSGQRAVASIHVVAEGTSGNGSVRRRRPCHFHVGGNPKMARVRAGGSMRYCRDAWCS